MICKGIVIHHSATVDSKFNDWNAIRKFHIEENGWRDIGYHAGIEMELGKFHVRYGRKINEQGAHCPPMNHERVGYCLIGNFTLDPPPVPMLIFACRELIIPTMRQFNLTKKQIGMHYEFMNTECPGKAFPKTLLFRVLDSVLGVV